MGEAITMQSNAGSLMSCSEDFASDALQLDAKLAASVAGEYSFATRPTPLARRAFAWRPAEFPDPSKPICSNAQPPSFELGRTKLAATFRVNGAINSLSIHFCGGLNLLEK